MKIEAQERQLDQQQVELDQLRGMERDDNDVLKMKLEKKISEVKLLNSSITKLQELLWKKDDVPLYEMSQSPHGLAVIFVNGKFDQGTSHVTLQPRGGASRDAVCFSQTFTFLQYKVQIHSDKTADAMRAVMSQIRCADHSNYDSFVCCVSSHGNQDGVYGSDSLVIHQTSFLDPIKSCISLQGKPKLFFFQACRVPALSANVPLPDTPSLPSSLHQDADILIANASTNGNPAFTSLETGSWFANAIQHIFTDPQLVYVRTLQQLLEEVTNMVSNAAGQSNGERVNQCVEVTTRMRKGVKFF